MTAILFMLFWVQNDDIVVDERFRVEYVVLDIRATTRGGELVTDLSPEDFVITENRKKVDITFFDVLDLRGTTSDQLPESLAMAEKPKPEVPVNPGPPVPQVILALDLDSAEHLGMLDAFDQTREFLASFADQNILLNVYSLQNGRVTQGFVTDVSVALADFDEYVDKTYGRMFDSGKEAFSELKGSTQDGPRQTRRPSTTLLPGPKSLSDIENAYEQCLRYRAGKASACIRDTLREVLEEQELQALRVINQIESLTYHFQDTQGLKIMYFISPGFSVEAPQAPQQLAQIYLNQLEETGREQDPSMMFRGSGYSLRDEYQRVVHAFIRNRVVFHTIDIFNTGTAANRSISAEHGLGSGPSLDRVYHQYEFDMGSGLSQLADDSGGSFHQLSRMAEFIVENIEQNRFYYVIGYTSPSSKPGKFRTIKIKSKRKGVKLSHRKGYIGAS